MSEEVDIEEQQAIEELQSMSFEELEKVPFEVVRQQCKIEGCSCFTRLRDYGIHPLYFRKNGFVSTDIGKHNWTNVYERFFMCNKHWKMYRNAKQEDIPLKKFWGSDDTGKEKIIY